MYTSDARQVMGLVSAVLGTEPLGATHLPFGHSSVSYDVALPGRSVIVRTNARPEVFAKTGHNLAILAGLGLPVPRLLAADLTKSRYHAAYLILDKIPGRDLRYELAGMTAAQMTRLAGRIVAFQRRVATLPPGAGFGWAPIGGRGPFPSWEGLIRSELRGRADRPEEDVVADLTARLERALPRFAPHFAGVRPGCFLDDVTIKNVIVQAGELQGLVDFDCVCYGTPCTWSASPRRAWSAMSDRAGRSMSRSCAAAGAWTTGTAGSSPPTRRCTPSTSCASSPPARPRSGPSGWSRLSGNGWRRWSNPYLPQRADTPALSS